VDVLRDGRITTNNVDRGKISSDGVKHFRAAYLFKTAKRKTKRRLGGQEKKPLEAAMQRAV